MNVMYHEHSTKTVIHQCKTLKRKKKKKKEEKKRKQLVFKCSLNSAESEGTICLISKPFCSNECLTSPKQGIK